MSGLNNITFSGCLIFIKKVNHICSSHLSSASFDFSIKTSIKTLSWSKRNQLISKNLNWDNTGNTSFSADGYVRDCLKEMIVEAPWGRTTEALLLSFDHRLGAALETLVPKAFGEGIEDTIDSGAVKKEQ